MTLNDVASGRVTAFRHQSVSTSRDRSRAALKPAKPAPTMTTRCGD
jgi:hypothetical protein